MSLKLFLDKHSSDILTAGTIIGVFTSVAFAITETVKVSDILKSKNPPKEKLKKVIPTYIPTIVATTATCACSIGSRVIDYKKIAALSATIATLSSYIKKYKDRLKMFVGKDDIRKIENAVEEYPDDEENGEDILFYDQLSDQYFTSTMFKVRTAEYYLNKKLTLDGYASVNDWLRELKLKPTKDGDNKGWTSDLMSIYMEDANWLDFNHDRAIIDDNSMNCCIVAPDICPDEI